AATRAAPLSAPGDGQRKLVPPVFPEAARRACPGYWPADDGEPVARVSAARPGKKPRRCIYPGASRAIDLQ
ncbi:TPA: hypothetical protein ACJTOO_005475, partial [Klebsiella oxytoca]